MEKPSRIGKKQQKDVPLRFGIFALLDSDTRSSHLLSSFQVLDLRLPSKSPHQGDAVGEAGVKVNLLQLRSASLAGVLVSRRRGELGGSAGGTSMCSKPGVYAYSEEGCAEGSDLEERSGGEIIGHVRFVMQGEVLHTLNAVDQVCCAHYEVTQHMLCEIRFWFVASLKKGRNCESRSLYASTRFSRGT